MVNREGMRDSQTTWFRAAIILAAALILLLVGGLVLSGRLWGRTTSSPPAINPAELTILERRPLLLPTVAPPTPCPLSQVSLQVFGLAAGSGPVYLVSEDAPSLTAWGGWAAYKFRYQPVPAPGLVLIRARDLKSGELVVFTQSPLGPSAITPEGRVVGSDHLLNRTVSMQAEAAFNDPAHTRAIDKRGTLPLLIAMLGLQRGASGCVGLQLDGPGFTEQIVVGWASGGLSSA